MKRLIKLLALVMSLLIVCVSFVACAPAGSGNGAGGNIIAGVNDNLTDKPVTPATGKFTLKIGNFNGGYGRRWLDLAVRRFEEQYKNTTWENGQVGVKVEVDNSTSYSGNFGQYVSQWPQHVILAENVYYTSLIRENHILNISDVVNFPIGNSFVDGTDNGVEADNKTIAQIMKSNPENYLGVPVKNAQGNMVDQYYAVPFYEASVGIVYDIDMFEEYGLYYAAEGYGTDEGFIQDADGNWIGQGGAVVGNKSNMTFDQAIAAGVKLGNGPDGDYETTTDNGLAQTYADFFALCAWIESRGMEAISWAGNTNTQLYLNYLAYSLWADYEGKDQMNLNYTLNGNATNLIDKSTLSADGKTYSLLPSTAITSANGYLLQQQAGKYEAIKFISDLVDNTNYYNESVCFADEITHKDMQKKYVESAYYAKNDPANNKRMAMLVDGSWWMNEANSYFADAEVNWGEEYAAENRNFGMMTLPKANESKVGEQSTISYNTSTIICLNKHTTGTNRVARKIAKTFLQFLHTQESLAEFTQVTNSARPFNYELTETQLNSLTDAGRRNYQIHNEVEMVYPYSLNALVDNNPVYFSCSGYKVFENAAEEVSLTMSFNANKSLSAKGYFNGMLDTHNASWWNRTFRPYL